MQVSERHVLQVMHLIDGGATIPFIARYRKEATGSMDEVQIAAISEAYARLLETARRREYIMTSIASQGQMTDALRQRLEDCWDATLLEDLYLPYKPKRRTRAQVAREHGLAPLAEALLRRPHIDPLAEAGKYLCPEVPDREAALQGARDIVAEGIAEDEAARAALRHVYRREAVIRSRVVKAKAESDEAAKYSDYFAWEEPLKRCTSHRLLAMRRGESEGVLRVSIVPADDAAAEQRIAARFVRQGTPAARHVAEAAADSYKRLLRPSIETEFAAESKAKADAEAIRVFATNLRQLLLAPPLGACRIMGIDPGFRTGCKVVCLDAQGGLLHHEAIFPHAPRGEYAHASVVLRDLIARYAIEAVAIGGGTAGRETEDLVRGLGIDGLAVFLVSEDGASVYSASKAAREEFPDEDVTVRGAISIGRRLADPLAELVKIDAKSLGVGQYQHDVDAAALRHSLDQTVEHCVNAVGVNLNTASGHLLTYVSGLGPALAQNIVAYRAEHGHFASRHELLQVPRLGAKAYEQCAGFLRIPEAQNPLDNTAVHPERYALVERMAADMGTDVRGLIADAAVRQRVPLRRYVSDEVGLPTLSDIMDELARPGRDPRGRAEAFAFAPGIRTIDDLQIGMVLPGIVTNVTAFGAFVDVGIKTKGLVHVSQLADRYVKDPSAVVALQQHVRVRVLEIDYRRGRIALSMRGL